MASSDTHHLIYQPGIGLHIFLKFIPLLFQNAIHNPYIQWEDQIGCKRRGAAAELMTALEVIRFAASPLQRERRSVLLPGGCWCIGWHSAARDAECLQTWHQGTHRDCKGSQSEKQSTVYLCSCCIARMSMQRPLMCKTGAPQCIPSNGKYAQYSENAIMVSL